ncbi:hypothetical protein F4818DRAFT_441667 [Hypoxylon cercidicola]|nr:hypothetical protein F4818DRAFT_441667 [Hypoxylon cercidicola]
MPIEKIITVFGATGSQGGQGGVVVLTFLNDPESKDWVVRVSGGKRAHVYLFDGQAKVAEYVDMLGISASYFMTGFYMLNLHGEMFKLSFDNTYTLGLPIASTAPPMYDTRDTGTYVKVIVLNKDKLLGNRLLGATSYRTSEEIVGSFKKVFPEAEKTARYVEVQEMTYDNDMKSKGIGNAATY